MSANMACVAHSYNLERANAQMKHLEATGALDDVNWALSHAFMLLEQDPKMGLTSDAMNAIDRAKHAFKTEGVAGALVHFRWLKDSLAYLGNCEINDSLEIVSDRIALTQ